MIEKRYVCQIWLQTHKDKTFVAYVCMDEQLQMVGLGENGSGQVCQSTFFVKQRGRINGSY